jgi:hypothetical protein
MSLGISENASEKEKLKEILDQEINISCTEREK